MAISEKKHNPTAYDFDIGDCQRVVEIYEEIKKESVSDSLNMDEMLHQFRTAYGIYMLKKSGRKVLTQTQLKAKHQNLRNKVNNLLNDLEEKTDTQFLNSLVCAMAGTKSPINIDNKIYRELLEEVYENLNKLEEPLRWLLKNLNLSTADHFAYLHTNPDSKARSTAENDFIRNLSKILSKHLGSGGRTNDDYTQNHRGWKIVSIEYLLTCVGITRSRGQITGAISTQKVKQPANKSSE